MRRFTLRVHNIFLLPSAFLFTITLAVGFVGAAPPEGKKHTYKEIDDRKLSLYVTKPDGWTSNDKRPAIVFFHGGGWVGGAPGQFTEHSKYLAKRGMVAVQVEYRLLNRKSNDPPESCISDATDAMIWVREHAPKLGIDPNRVATGGGSAGGHLAAYLGCVLKKDASTKTVSAKSNAMVLFNPVYDNGPKGWGTKRVGDRYMEFSPFHNISKDDPPNVVFLGTNDKLIPVSTAESFKMKMKEIGVKSELFLYEGQPHGFFNYGKDGNKWYEKTIAETDRFLVAIGWIDEK